ncbi:MAG TPA: hypothetical protein PLE48_12760 [Thiobacillus sp.]|nr:hypothetical protein [Thiobacillus sp.]HQT71280.1 hypothetical protein [Thiobacillus sp.]
MVILYRQENVDIELLNSSFLNVYRFQSVVGSVGNGLPVRIQGLAGLQLELIRAQWLALRHGLVDNQGVKHQVTQTYADICRRPLFGLTSHAKPLVMPGRSRHDDNRVLLMLAERPCCV